MTDNIFTTLIPDANTRQKVQELIEAQIAHLQAQLDQAKAILNTP